jgi:hypothetical protein
LVSRQIKTMACDPDRKPTLTEAGRREAAERHQRQAAALRENLAKRKAQQRARAVVPADQPPDGKNEPPRDR